MTFNGKDNSAKAAIDSPSVELSKPVMTERMAAGKLDRSFLVGVSSVGRTSTGGSGLIFIGGVGDGAGFGVRPPVVGGGAGVGRDTSSGGG